MDKKNNWKKFYWGKWHESIVIVWLSYMNKKIQRFARKQKETKADEMYGKEQKKKKRNVSFAFTKSKQHKTRKRPA